MRAVDAPNREEALTATLVQKSGPTIDLSARIFRRDRKISLGETEVLGNAAHFMFAPICAAWGHPIPDAWLKEQ
jgi:hypothetical protein